MSNAIPKAIQDALAHQKAGRLPQAEAIYRQILQVEPRHPDALHFLGLIAQQVGRYEIASELIGKAVTVRPSSQMHYNLGIAFQAQGKLDQAIKSYRQALALKPDFAEGHDNLGIALQAQGQLDEAITSYRKALSLKPGLAGAHYNLGNALQELGRLDQAIASYRQALLLKPDFAVAHGNMGNALRSQGKLDEAIACYRQALALKTDSAEVHCNLGNALRDQGRLDDAFACYQHALALTPDSAEVHCNLGNALRDRGLRDGAVASYRNALSLKPDMPEVHCNLGQLLGEQGEVDEAFVSYRQALALKPVFAEAHAGLASIHMDMGQFEAAQAALDKALKFEPEHPYAWAILAMLRKMTPEDEGWLNTALRLLAKPTLLKKDMVWMRFSLGKYYNDTKQYDLAFPAYRQANTLQRQLEGKFDRTSFSSRVNTIIAAYPAEFLTRHRAEASPSRRPVLVLGMPRSGTSLVEQIIASHPQAFGAGELFFWGAQAASMQAAENLNALPVAPIAAAYEQLLQQHSAEAIRIVDKMPSNFLHLGLAHAVFPQASIIHMQRNPVDTCLSIYFQHFNSTHAYATDMEDIVFYYREYFRLMRHWRAALPADRFLEVPYEALTEHQAEWSQRIIEFIGLDWDERCLDFHKTERKVGTASNWQVRQKIYHASKERWRHYEAHLEPLLGLLELNQSE